MPVTRFSSVLGPSLSRVVLASALACGASAATTIVQAQAAESAPARLRVIVLVPGGDPALARALGPGVRDRATEALGAEDALPTVGPEACTGPDCAPGLLADGAADFVLALAVWGRAGVCERVAATLVDGEGNTFDAEARVGEGGVPAAVAHAVTSVLDRARGGPADTLLHVEGAPEGASLTLDQLPWGSLPHEAPVSRGDHVLAVSAEGYATERRPLVIGDEPVALSITLRPLTASDPGRADPLPFYIGAGGLCGAGLAALGVGLYGALAPATLGSDGSYETGVADASAAWLVSGALLVGAGVVTFFLAPASGSSTPASVQRGALITF